MILFLIIYIIIAFGFMIFAQNGTMLLIGIILSSLIIPIITFILKLMKKSNYKSNKYEFNGKINQYVLTYSENIFFKQLERIVNGKYYIFPKMRIADIIETTDINNFNKICSKHIDFTICNKSFQPILFIELDDYTHNFKKNKEKDIKKDKIFKSLNKKIIRVNENNKDKTLYEIDKMLNNKN